MVGSANLKSCQLSNLDENMIQLTISPKNSTASPSVISLSGLEVGAVDGDELNIIDQFHGDVSEKLGKFNSCASNSSRNASMEQEVSRCQTSYIMDTPKDNENNPDYTRSNDGTIKYSSMDSRYDMPEHLLFNILLWLPVITLLRFKPVCKSWYALIGSSRFVAEHFEHNCGEDNLLGIHFRYDDDRYIAKSCLLSGNKYEVCNEFDCGQPWDFVEDINVKIHGIGCLKHSNKDAYHGIVCLVHSKKDDVALWNPAMKQLRVLPKSPAPCEDVAMVFTGFGFNVKSNDYNFLRTLVCKGNMLNSLVQVYSLRSDSWRSIHKNFAAPLRLYESFDKNVDKNGTFFWIARPDAYSIHDDVILSFDLNDEIYETMPLPVKRVTNAVLDFLGDKLAFIDGLDYHCWHNGASNYAIWVLGEYGVKESWSIVWKIGPTTLPCSDDVRFPSGLSKNGEYLLLSDFYCDSGHLFLYDLGTEENEYLQLQQPNLRFRWVVRYTESLVSVKRVNEAYQ